MPAEILLQHIAAVGRLRLHLATAYPEATWESERAIRLRCGGVPLRRADGGLWWPDGAAVGVELEGYVKKPPRYAGVVRNADEAWSAGVWWFTPPELVALLTRRLQEAGGGDFHQVYELPEGVAP